MSNENPFEANLIDPYKRFLEEAGVKDSGKREAKETEGPTKEYVGKTQWKAVVYGSPKERGWSPAHGIGVKRSSERSVAEMLNPKSAEREADAMEKFAQSMALSIRRAVENDSAAAELARGLSAVAESYKEGAFVIPGEVMENLDRNKPGRADWALRKIEGAIKRHGRSEVADVLELLAQIFDEG